MMNSYKDEALPRMRNPQLAEWGINKKRNAEWLRYLPYLKLTQKCFLKCGRCIFFLASGIGNFFKSFSAFYPT